MPSNARKPDRSGLHRVLPGKIILINGASSSGKSTLAQAVQKQIDEPFWHLSIDHLRDSGVLPLDRMRAGDFDWTSMRPAFFQGFHNALPAIAAAGNNLIVEHIVETRAWMTSLLRLLGSLDVYFVGIHCPLDELERREQARGDRRIGEARNDFGTIHAFAAYDLELDSTQSADGNAAILIAAWRRRREPSAFRRMAATD
jgi:chloramphenicol 3-O phosphotransferase